MDFKGILFLIFVSALLLGSVSGASSVNSFNIDKSYDNVFAGDYSSLYLNQNKDSGITIYKNMDDDAYNEDMDDSIGYDDLVHDDGREYLIGDDDFTINKNSDNTASFKDLDHAEHGVVEIVKSHGQEYIVVFWAKNSSNISNKDLTSLLNDFNKDNKVDAIAF